MTRKCFKCDSSKIQYTIISAATNGKCTCPKKWRGVSHTHYRMKKIVKYLCMKHGDDVTPAFMVSWENNPGAILN